MDDWDWMTAIDPVKIEHERFNVSAPTVKRREGTQLGYLHVEPTQVERRRLRDKETLTLVAGNRQALHSRIRSLETTLTRERRERRKEQAWRNRVEEIKARDIPGPSSLEHIA